MDQYRKQNYVYRPAPKRAARPRGPEEERERYYALIRHRIDPERLHRLSWVNIAVLCGALLAFFLGSLLGPKPERSAMEKRDLARFPAFSAEALRSGTFTRDIETWYADTFPFRDGFVGLSAVVDEAHGVRVDDVRIVAPSGGEAQDLPDASNQPPAAPQEPQPAPAGPGDSSSAPETQSDASSAPETPPAVDDGAAPGAITGGTFVYRGMAMSLYGGDPASGKWYAQVLNSYHEELPDVQIYNMIIPTAIEFYVPDKYRDLTQSQKAMIDLVHGTLAPSIKKVDAYSELAAHTDEYIYFRTDHHWTGLGAYYAYRAFCGEAGLTPKELSDFETRRLDDFIGTMYSQTQDTTLLKNPDYVDYYLFKQPYEAQRFLVDAPYSGVDSTLWGEYAQSPNSYSVFLHGDFPLVQVKTGIGNGRRILVVKESFGNAFAPFLINHYDEVYIVDQRYFQLPLVDFIREHGINELVFANNSFAVCTPYHIRCIDNMRHQVFVPRALQADVPKAGEPEESGEDAREQEEQEPPDEGDRPRRLRPRGG